jgi:ATP-dependent Lhr-like helicase
VRFFFRGEGAWFIGPPDESPLSATAEKVHEFLRSEGASFTADLTGVGPKSQLQAALVELVSAGMVTNDTLDALRVIDEPHHAPPLQKASALESELATRLGTRPLTRSRYQDAKRRVAHRLRAELPAQPSAWPGRWSLVHRTGILGQFSDDERADRLARVLLARYGIVTRDALEREDMLGEWARLYPVFQRMEMRGEIRRGYFVEGLGGAQFALPEAIEQLRAPSTDALFVLNSADPANIFGGELGAAPRFARVPSTHVIFSRGQPILVAEDSGERILTSPAWDQDLITRALRTYLARPNAARHTVIEKWNGESVQGSALEPILHALGFNRTPKGMELWA